MIDQQHPAPSTSPNSRSSLAAGPKPSVIAQDVLIEGKLSGGEIQIDGAVRGDVRVHLVSVGDSAKLDGGIYAETVDVRGKVAGSITAKQVRLFQGCHVDGDISHEQLFVEVGALFHGRSLRL